MNVSDFDFELPDALIGQEPRPRGGARLMVVRRAAQTWEERSVADLPALLDAGDVIVLNDTRVFPARLIGRREKLMADLVRLENDHRNARGDRARYASRREDLVAALEHIYGALDDPDDGTGVAA